MAAYYNEHDPYAAQWLRNLIAAGHIAPGEVDERDIRDIRYDELHSFNQCHFFAGIGVWSHALRRAGWPDDRPIWTGSCPCQPFSAAGKQAGFDDERHLWPVWQRLIAQCRPPIVLGEQVAGALEWLDLVSADMENAGYAFGASDLCAAGFDGAHIRQRLYFVGMADADDEGSQGRAGMPERAGERAAGARGVAGRLADADRGQCNGIAGGEGRERDGSQTGWVESNREFAAGGATGRLADAHSQDRGGRGICRPGESVGAGDRAALERSAGFCATGRLADAECDERRQVGEIAGGCGSGSGTQGLGERSGDGGSERGRLADTDGGHTSAERQQPGGQHGQQQADDSTLSVGSAHAPMLGRHAADWLYCRDGKWRPVEPGTFPLVDAAASRVGRLRAYGNGLDAETATQFVGAVMECL